jgi:hypothetical protein
VTEQCFTEALTEQYPRGNLNIIKMRSRKKLVLLFVVLLISVLIYVVRANLYKKYIVLFHKNGIVSHYDKNGQLTGEYIAYVDGNIYGKSYFINGLREGWCIWYNEKTGRKKDEVFYKAGKVDSIENVYYENGNLNYTVNWKNGRYVDGEYHYLSNGKLNTYNAFDQSKKSDNGYCYVAYDGLGNFHQILGNVFSSYVYTKCKDSVMALNNNNKYTCLENLYLSVAKPPELNSLMDIFINNTKVHGFFMGENNLVIKDAFNNKGVYHIFIRGKLINKSGAIIKADSLKITVAKE